MSDNITLPRAVAEQVRKALESMQSYAAAERKGLRICDEAVITLTAALAEPRPAPSLEFFDGFRDGFRAAERHHGIAKEDK